jgi:hypothetical protein
VHNNNNNNNNIIIVATAKKRDASQKAGGIDHPELQLMQSKATASKIWLKYPTRMNVYTKPTINLVVHFGVLE